MNPIYNIGWIFFKCLFKILFDYKAYGYENIPSNSNFIIVSNHVSFFDPPLIGIAFDSEINYFARSTLFNSKIKEYILKRTKALPIDRDKPTAKSIKNVLNALKAGESLVLFPEGERSADGKVKSAKPGISLFVSNTKVPIIPAKIFGSYEAYPKGRKFPKTHPIRVVFGEKINIESILDKNNSKKQSYKEIADLITKRIAEIKLPQ